MQNVNAKPTTLQQGTKVRANGYDGVIIRLYNADPVIYEIRLPGGPVATGDFEIIDTRPEFLPGGGEPHCDHPYGSTNYRRAGDVIELFCRYCAHVHATAPAEYFDDIPASLSHAYNWVSQHPEARFAGVRFAHAETLSEDLALFTEHAQKGGATDQQLAEEFARYRDGLSKRTIAAVASDSRCASSFITGGSNFPARRMEKRNDIAMRRWSELVEFRKRVCSAIIGKLNPAAVPSSNVIRAEDSDAVGRLQHKIECLERDQTRMRAVNAAHKRFLKDPSLLDASGLDDDAKALVRSYKPAYAWEPHPFPPYRLSNNSAEIRRAKGRLEQVSALKAAPATEQDGAAARLEDAPADNRVRLFFPGKPAEQVRSDLKRNGFRWTPSLGCWQAYRNTRALEVAKRLAGVQS